MRGVAVGTNVEVGMASNVSRGTSVGVETTEMGVAGTGVREARGARMVWFGKLHADVKTTIMKMGQQGFIHSSISDKILTRPLTYRNSPSDLFSFWHSAAAGMGIRFRWMTFTFSRFIRRRKSNRRFTRPLTRGCFLTPNPSG